MSAPAVVESAYDLLQIVELTGVKTYEIRARLVDPQVDLPDYEPLPMEVMVRHEGDVIEARLRLEHRTDEAVLLADIGVLYNLATPRTIPNAVLGEFLEKVGVMAVFPFAREGLLTSAARLGEIGRAHV